MAQLIALVSLIAAPIFAVVGLVVHPSPDRPFTLSGWLIAAGFILTTWMATISFVRPTTWASAEDPLVEIELINPQDWSLEVTLSPVLTQYSWSPPAHLNTQWKAWVSLGEAPPLPASGRGFWSEGGVMNKVRVAWIARPTEVQTIFPRVGPYGIRNDVLYFDKFRRTTRGQTPVKPDHLEVSLAIYDFDEVPTDAWTDAPYPFLSPQITEEMRPDARGMLNATAQSIYGAPENPEQWFQPSSIGEPWNMAMAARLFYRDREVWSDSAIAVSAHAVDDHVYGVFKPVLVGEARKTSLPQPLSERYPKLFVGAYVFVLVGLLASGIGFHVQTPNTRAQAPGQQAGTTGSASDAAAP